MKRMYILIVVVAIMTTIAGVLTACGNKQIFDTTYIYEKCIVALPNGEVLEAEVDSWKDYDDGDQIQVRIDGKDYLVHSSNIVLISE